MDKTIITNYRKCVTDEDTCYFLGDLTIVGPQHRHSLEHLVMQLPGRKILILGNHDKHNPFTYMEVGFESVHTVLDIGEFILVHDPAIATRLNNRKWLCGHIHCLFRKRKNVYNVGVDVHGFFPISIIEVQKDFEKNIETM